MIWLTNMGKLLDRDPFIFVGSWQTQEEVRRDLRLYLEGKIIGRPKASAMFTVEQLEKMGLVGVYVADAE